MFEYPGFLYIYLYFERQPLSITLWVVNCEVLIDFKDETPRGLPRFHIMSGTQQNTVVLVVRLQHSDELAGCTSEATGQQSQQGVRSEVAVAGDQQSWRILTGVKQQDSSICKQTNIDGGPFIRHVLCVINM